MIKRLLPLFSIVLLALPLVAAPIGFKPVVSDGTLSAKVDVAASYQIAVTATPAVSSYSASGLPTGMTVDAATGLIGGAPKVAGTFDVQISAKNSYGTGTANLRVVVSKGEQTVTFDDIPAQLLKPDPISLSAASSVGLPVTFTVVSGPGTVSGNQLTLTAAGTITVRASQPGNENYLAADPVTKSVVVTIAAATVELLAPDAEYDGNPKAAEVHTVPEGLNVVVTYNGSETPPTTPGSYTVVATVEERYYAGSATATMNISIANATVEIGEPDAIFDGTPKPVAVTTVPEGLNVVVTYDGSEVPPSAVGNYTVVATIDEPYYAGSATVDMLIGYGLNVSALNGGSVSVSPLLTVYPQGTVVTLVPHNPDSGSYVFSRWMGDVDYTAELSDPLAITMDSSKTLVCNFIGNSSAPTDISIEPSYLLDSTVAGTTVAKLHTTDPDVGDTFVYELVSGYGDYSNSLFTISGDELVLATLLNYSSDLNHTLSVRVRSIDSAGQSVEDVIRLDLVDATPYVKFDYITREVSAPYVTAFFRLEQQAEDMTLEGQYRFGRGVNLPLDYVKQNPGLFEIVEDDVTLSLIEGCPYVGKIDEVPTTIRTILLIDNSASVGGVLDQIRDAAKLMLSNLLPGQQVAVYTFSDSLVQKQDFTTDKALLAAAIESIQVGSATTDLNGSIFDALDLWTDSISIDAVDAGFLVVITDGRDQAGRVLMDDVIDKRDDVDAVIPNPKRVMLVGLSINGEELDTDGIKMLSNAGYWEASLQSGQNSGNLGAILASVQDGIVEEANSYYWLRYVSPKRGGADRDVEIHLDANTLEGTNSYAVFAFNSVGFADTQRRVVINPSLASPDGTDGPITIATGDTVILEAATYYALTTSEYVWTADNAKLIGVTDLSIDGSQSLVRIEPKVASGTVQLTVSDAASIALTDNTGIDPAVFTKTITLVIGSGASDGEGSPWPTAEDLANGWYDSDWYGLFDAYYFPWMWHFEHGWIWAGIGNETDGLYIYDTSLSAWFWTSADFYPWVYAYDPVDSWMWYNPGGKPGMRVFYVDIAASWMTEAQIINGWLGQDE